MLVCMTSNIFYYCKTFFKALFSKQDWLHYSFSAWGYVEDLAVLQAIFIQTYLEKMSLEISSHFILKIFIK